MSWPRSLRTRLVVVVVVAGIAPLALLGIWLTSAATRSGEEMVRDRLDALLATSAGAVGTSWLDLRSDLLDLTETAGIASQVIGEAAAAPAEPPPLVERLSLRDLSDRALWSVQRTGAPERAASRPLLSIGVPVFRGRSTERIGMLQAAIDFATLLEDPQVGGLPLGTVLAALDPATGSSLLPVPFDRALLARERFEWRGENWITLRRTLREPPVELVAAAPLSPLTQAFERAAERGLLMLGTIALLSLLLTVSLTGVMTRSLRRLTVAAEAVARGELEHRVERGGNDEIGRVADAFNTMTTSLRSTLRELADRQALAAVGEFAASLSHEVRNALSSIRLDLQVSGERLPDDPLIREPQDRALREIARLEQTVSGSLELARSGRIEQERLDLWYPLTNAMAAARPEFKNRGARLREPPGGPAVNVVGDAAGLEQLFLNLLLNAAQATGAGGTTTVHVEKRGPTASVSIEDDGPGMKPEVLNRAFEAFYSTRPDGTGLGLSVARRIARVHAGRLAIETEPGRGTVVEVRLPLAEPLEEAATGDGTIDPRHEAQEV